MTEILVKAEELSKSFGSTQAVKGISLQVSAGEIYAWWPGWGWKNHSFTFIMRGAHPDHGNVYLGDMTFCGRPTRPAAWWVIWRSVFALYEELTVMENIRFFAEVRGLLSGEWEARSNELLEFVGLKNFSKRRAGQLSGE